MRAGTHDRHRLPKLQDYRTWLTYVDLLKASYSRL
jgi:hypothetical protein